MLDDDALRAGNVDALPLDHDGPVDRHLLDDLDDLLDGSIVGFSMIRTTFFRLRA